MILFDDHRAVIVVVVSNHACLHESFVYDAVFGSRSTCDSHPRHRRGVVCALLRKTARRAGSLRRGLDKYSSALVGPEQSGPRHPLPAASPLREARPIRAQHGVDIGSRRDSYGLWL